VLALGGTTVCRRGSTIIAYDGIYGQALARDTRGRPLPDWQGCRTLHDGEAFFMNWDSPDSFDSRYFGPLPVTTIVGRAIPVWTTDAADPAAESSVRRSPTSRDGSLLQPGKDIAMPQIGTFTKTKTGFSGRVRTLALDAELTIRPAEKSDAENAPDYRIFAAEDLEVGAAWSRSGERAGDYLSTASTIRPHAAAARRLFQSEADAKVWNLMWSRPTKRDDKG
jgi:uncharacterized protein (DUF736 family)